MRPVVPTLTRRMASVGFRHMALLMTSSASAGAGLSRSNAGSPAMFPGLDVFAPHQQLAERAKEYLDGSPDPFFATENSCRRLEDAGYTRLDERDAWSGKLKKGGKYFFTRNRSCVVAFTVGGEYESGNGFKVVGAHTDSPNLRIKPRSKRSGAGCLQLEVECYGGGLWHTWFDRDLGISGRVMVRTEDGGIEQRLVRINRPILRVPTLCIHLQSPDEREAFKVNKEDHLQPILATEALKALDGSSDNEDGADGEAATASADGEAASAPSGGDTSAADELPKSTAEMAAGDAGKESVTAESSTHTWGNGQEPLLVQMLASELGVSTEAIVDFEMSLFDVQEAAITGVHCEFLCSSRIDNLASCFVALEALVEHGESDALREDTEVSLIALFDHEEVGSASNVGAGSPIMGEAVRRISSALSTGGGGDGQYDDTVATSLRRSFVISADMAHAVHPNYAAKHQKGHGPQMNRGIVIKSNANQRYASNRVTSLVVRELSRRAALPAPQEFVVRNDCPCGSTIGPVISASTGMRAVDIGMPQLSMHSIREMMGVADLTICRDLFVAFYRDFHEVDDMLGG